MWQPPLWMMVLGYLTIFLGFASPGLLAFLGARLWRLRGGVAGLVIGYVGPLIGFAFFIAAAFPCRGCARPPKPWTHVLSDYGHGVASIYYVSWGWHLAWLSYGVLGLWAGLWIRERRELRRKTDASRSAA